MAKNVKTVSGKQGYIIEYTLYIIYGKSQSKTLQIKIKFLNNQIKDPVGHFCFVFAYITEAVPATQQLLTVPFLNETTFSTNTFQLFILIKLVNINNVLFKLPDNHRKTLYS